MSLVLEIDAFSGRPNPTVELDDDEVNDVVERLRPQARLAPVPDLTPPSYLGYRGVIVRGADAYVPDLPEPFRRRGETIAGPGPAPQPADIAVGELITGPEGPFRRLEEPELLARLRELVPSARREIYEWPWWKYLPWPWVNPWEGAPL